MINYRKLAAVFRTSFKVQDRYRPYMYVPFVVNSAQRDFLELCGQAQDQHALCWIIGIKPRRVGLSRVISGIGTAMSFQIPGMNGVVMAQLGSTLGKIMKSIEIMAKGLPVASRSQMSGSTKGGREVSSVSVGKGEKLSVIEGSKALATGEGRGDAALFEQLTEAAHYPPQSPFTAMLPLVPRTMDSFVGIESTPSPDRRGVAFREMWENARWIHERRRDALFIRYFCPWMKDPYAFDPVVRRDPSLIKDAPIDNEEKLLLKIGVGLDQIAWRRQEIKGRYRGKKELFEQENPSDPMSCFTQVEMPAFSLEERAWARQTVVNDIPYIGFLEPTTEKDLGFPIRIRIADNGVWRIYEEPQKRCEYYIGVDGARGLDIESRESAVTDYSAVVVINGTTSAVAAVLETRLPPDKVAREVALAGKFYRTSEISQFHYAWLNIAITDGYGNEIQRRLKSELNYPLHRFLRWRGRDDHTHSRASQNIGWIDTAATNQMRVDAFRITLSNRQFHVRDARLAEQIQGASLTSAGDAEDYRGHDDVLDAAMYAWIARDMERPREQILIGLTQPILSPQLLTMANDPSATFNRIWTDVQKLSHPANADRVGQILTHINGKSPGVFV